MAAFNSSSDSSQYPSWLGFVLGILGGVAVSCLLVGMAVGYTLSGGMPLPSGPGPAANVPSVPNVPSAPVAAKAVPPVTDRDHVRGAKNAKVTVIEYSDFECPFCKRHAPTLDQLLTLYKDEVNIVFRHFPLSFHANAQKEAEASECVAELAGNDAFWKFHDLLFERSTVGGTGFALDKLPALAKEVGADEAKFKTCLDTGKYAQYVQDQQQQGVEAGVQGTPGNFVINNKTKDTRDVSGAVPVTSFQTIIDEMLKS